MSNIIQVERASAADIEVAAKMGDLDVAVSHIQAVIGQTDGGVAAQYFSGFDDEHHDWAVSTEKQRADWLREYLEVEQLYSPQD